jgi:SAM-dependent methyltransferase
MKSENESHSDTQITTNQWYASWFDTPFYHILYKDRDYTEAQQFVDTLTDYLNLPEKAKVLDLACGKGRHSIYLSTLGYEVTGVDLSENSIQEANKNANEMLHFKVHDMRLPMPTKFEAVFNLFTSFGYFDHESDNLKTLQAIKENLTEDGFAVIDFMNVDYVIENLVPDEIKTVDGIDFYIKRFVNDHHIYKEIRFEFEEKNYEFVEKVKALTLQDFERLMEEAGIYLLDIFGDYKLKKFSIQNSERLILIFK